MKRADGYLLLVYVLVCSALYLRIRVEPTGFISPDSEYYLECAQNLLDGRGFLRTDAYPIPTPRDETRQVFFAAWPVGYPLMIAGLGWLTGLSLFWASKLLSAGCIGGMLLLFRHIDREHAWVLGLVFGTHTLLDVYSFTWSEVPFNFGILAFCLLLYRFVYGPGRAADLGLLGLCSVFLFLCRYIGVVGVLVMGAVGVYSVWSTQKAKGRQLLIVSVASGLLIALYLYMNYRLSGYPTGIARNQYGVESWGAYVYMVGRGLLSEAVLADVALSWRPLSGRFIVLGIFQLVLLLVFYLREGRRVYWVTHGTYDALARVCLGTGAAYLVLLLVLRRISLFEALYGRHFSPFLLLWLVAGLLYLIAPERRLLYRRALPYELLLFGLSYVLNTPKTIVLDWIRHLFG
ncbi:hypothetical protein SAMN05421823_109206 [Catalinimonas alkaloidigena]|uniref:Dolichyl-phosphate-mannose-protein mannosyltransferase n=1 Tax=Catalinimonas alkaloidigena TaxID=1075417 RepID=A0A1G9PIA8_9BACT|nr:hypothetical protein [Catalinimonas alkaloidigena]SDL98576.1 hypothetical protein SAMN05421823_109206 [Catalinimonas alkaloidigena]